MMKLVFATNNPHKLDEVRFIAGSKYQIISLSEAGIAAELPEDHFTLEENALQKVSFIANHYHMNAFADDSGLEVDALHGEPGVFSSRYARMGNLQFPDLPEAEGNIKKLLESMKSFTHRKARFRTIIALILDGRKYFFEGTVNGIILQAPKGNSGFGYDPVFQPDGFHQSFAEMPAQLKNSISHRATAVKKLAEFLQSNF